MVELVVMVLLHLYQAHLLLMQAVVAVALIMELQEGQAV
jgi:hypothetical protein